MKHLILMLACLFIMYGVAQAGIDWRPVNQSTLSWDPSVVLSDGITPIPSADVITYDVHTKNEDGTNQAIVGPSIQCCSFTITFKQEGRYLAGVSTVRLTPTGVLIKSPIVWSDDPAYASVPFGYEHYYYALPASGLVPQ